MFKSYLEWITPEKRKELETAGKMEKREGDKEYNGFVPGYIRGRMNSLGYYSNGIKKLIGYYNTMIETIPKSHNTPLHDRRFLLTPSTLYAAHAGGIIHVEMLFWWAVTTNINLDPSSDDWNITLNTKFIMLETIFPDSTGKGIIKNLIKAKKKIQNKIVTNKTTFISFSESYDTEIYAKLLRPTLNYLREYKNFILVPLTADTPPQDLNEWLTEQEWDN